MNKKIIAVVIAVLVVVALGGYLLINNSNSNSSNKETGNNNSVKNDSSSNEDNIIEGGSNILVLYFSESGNTETVANFIHDEVGGDLIKLETVKAYPSDYDELVDYAQEEQRDDGRPELKTVIENIDSYDTIFLGYPNW